VNAALGIATADPDGDLMRYTSELRDWFAGKGEAGVELPILVPPIGPEQRPRGPRRLRPRLIAQAERAARPSSHAFSSTRRRASAGWAPEAP
jgi:hypothetical protein